MLQIKNKIDCCGCNACGDVYQTNADRSVLERNMNYHPHVTLDDGNERRSYTLNRPYQGLLIKPGMWRTLDDFSSGSVCLVLASEKYDAADYIRGYEDFLAYKQKQ